MRRHLVDTTLFFAPHSGGVKRYLLTKHRYLAEQAQFRHTLIVPGAADCATDAGVVQIRSLKIPFGGGYRMPLRLDVWGRTLSALEPDIIEAGDPYQLSWVASGVAARLGVPCVAFVHSDVALLIRKCLGAWAGTAAGSYLRKVYGRFDLVLAPSCSLAEKLRRCGVERVETQPLGVDDTTFNPARSDPNLRSELGLKSETRLLIFAGRISKEKRIPLLRSAIEELGPSYHLLLVGGRVFERMSAQVTAIPYQHDDVRLARLLASADALVHAGECETFGLVILEAMACGRPVVGVRSGAVPELIDASVGALAEPDDVDSLKKAICRLYDSDLVLLGANARARVEHRHTWRQVLRQLTGRYARLAGDRLVHVPERAGVSPR